MEMNHALLNGYTIYDPRAVWGDRDIGLNDDNTRKDRHHKIL